MPQESSLSTSKIQPTKLKLKDTTSTKPIVEEKKTTKEGQVPSPIRRRGANGKVVITYKDNSPVYDLSGSGSIHMGLIKRDLYKLHREFLVAERDRRVKTRLDKVNKG